jgi:acetylornithine deacetylase/succinyl-diaminopimelate desuccinylase-like protein
MRTTCVATRLAGGHANNALPQRADAVVNCRILPGHSTEEVRQDLIKVLADPRITVRYIDSNGQVQDKGSEGKGYPPPPLKAEIMKPLEALVNEDWPGLKVVPNMSVGASDGVYTSAAGMPTYTITGIDIDKDNERAHGRDERLGVESFYKGNEFYYQYLKALTSQ